MANGMTIALRNAGKQLLEELDNVGLQPNGAGWVHDSEADRWFYLVLTPLIDERGPYWIYERLLRLFNRRPLPAGVSPLDLRIYSPLERGMSGLLSAIRTEDGEAEMLDCNVFGMRINHAIFYRMSGLGASAGSARQFDEGIRSLEAA